MPNLDAQNAPDCISEYFNFKNFLGGIPLDPPRSSHLWRFGWALPHPSSPPVYTLSTATSFEKENQLCLVINVTLITNPVSNSEQNISVISVVNQMNKLMNQNILNEE